MKFKLFFATVPMIYLTSVVAVPSARATLVAQWNFTAGSGNPLSGYAASSQSTHVSSPVLSTSGGGAAQPTATSAVLNYAFGSGAAPTVLNGAIIALDITASTANYATFTATYTAQSAKVTALTGTWTFWINSGTHTTLPPETISIGSGSFSPNSDILTGAALLAGDTLHLQFQLSGTVASPGSSTMQFDDLTINATETVVPEPANVSLALFGLGFVGVAVGRRIYKNRTTPTAK